MQPDQDEAAAFDRQFGVAIAALEAAGAEARSFRLVVDGCQRCFPRPELDLLGGDPAAVPDDLVGSFARKHPEHWSGSRCATSQYALLWRRLAPRIVRLVHTAGEHSAPDYLLRGLAAPEVGFACWPAAERVAMLAALRALLPVALLRWRPDPILTLVSGLAAVNDDLTPWLRQVDRLTGRLVDAAFVRTICAWAVDLLWGYEPVSCRDSAADGAALRAWLCSARVRYHVLAFTDRHPSCKTAADALVALDALEDHDRSPWLYPGYRGVCDLGPLRARTVAST